MQRHPEIKRFVQETLGCSCPEAVFDKIEYASDPSEPWQRKVTVGDRLLIYIIDAEREPDLPGKMASALELGLAERNSRGLNRFRLVLVSTHPDEVRGMAEQAFQESAYHDERTHLHILGENEIAGLEN